MLRYLTATELANRYANRFLLIAVKRSAPAVRRRARRRPFADPRRCAWRCASPATSPDHVDDTARERSIDAYGCCRQPSRPGRAATAAPRRAPPPGIDLRLLDLSKRIASSTSKPRSRSGVRRRLRPLDLRRSARRPARRRDLGRRNRRPGGLTRAKVSDMFSRNKKRREIEPALSVLERQGDYAARPTNHDAADPQALDPLPTLAT